MFRSVSSSLPEEDVPEQQPAGVDQQSQQGVHQRAVQGVVQDALRDDREEEHPALRQRDRRLPELLEEEDAVEERAAGTEQHHHQGTHSSEETEPQSVTGQFCGTWAGPVSG